MPLEERKVNDHKSVINICGLPFTVNELETNELSGENIGSSCFDMLEINIAKGLHPEMKQQTLIHEWIHMLLDANAFLKESEDEKLVSVLSNELYRCGFRLEIEEKLLA